MFWFKLTMIFFILCFETEALKAGDDGVCMVKISSQKSRLKAYGVVVNKWCGKKRCVVRKTRKETYTISTNQTVCCKGWEYKSDSDTCSVFCSTGCVEGRCVAPDVCQCDAPLHLDPDHKNRCIRPSCESDCFNADCVSNNTCSCKKGFVTHNATHCAPDCDPGFILNEKLECTPKCDKNCVNSNCTGPNICTCNHGYKPKDKFACEPTCEFHCTNGACVKPNTCSCNEGYLQVNASNCIPKCSSCQNGYCKSPNVCNCHKGYKKIDGVCQPVCRKACVNGICSAPDICSCNRGYIKNQSKPNVCEKIVCNTCNERGECIDDRTDDLNNLVDKILR